VNPQDPAYASNNGSFKPIEYRVDEAGG